jgi:hypothetical protein
MKITVETLVHAPVAKVWSAYTTPADIMRWNTASVDWHTTKSEVDLRVGGTFSSRMEAKDGSRPDSEAISITCSHGVRSCNADIMLRVFVVRQQLTSIRKHQLPKQPVAQSGVIGSSRSN